MSDVDNARARAEAMNEPVGRALQSARRAQLWAGLNRYLASEAVHAHHAKEADDKATSEAGVEGEKTPPGAEEQE